MLPTDSSGFEISAIAIRRKETTGAPNCGKRYYGGHHTRAQEQQRRIRYARTRTPLRGQEAMGEPDLSPEPTKRGYQRLKYKSTQLDMANTSKGDNTSVCHMVFSRVLLQIAALVAARQTNRARGQRKTHKSATPIPFLSPFLGDVAKQCKTSNIRARRQSRAR